MVVMLVFENNKINQTHLVDIADHNRRKENLRERDSDGVHSGNHRGIHEVDGVAIQKDCCTTHCNTDYHRPEYVFEPLKKW